MKSRSPKTKRVLAVLLCAIFVFGCVGCGQDEAVIVEQGNVVDQKELVFFSPTAKGNEKVEGNAMASIQLGIDTFEKTQPDMYLSYKSYTARDYREKSYDDVVKERVHNHMGDDIYIMNPDVAYVLSQEGCLMDLSHLEAVPYLTDDALDQCVVEGKVISIPMTMICYSLYVNEDLLKSCGLELPQTKQDFLRCCAVLKEHGITPLAANRWWMENFVLTQGFAPLYLEEGKEEKIAALNSGQTPISQYMRPGFEFLAEMIAQGYFDVDFAKTAEAGDESDLFLNQQAAFVVHNDAAIQDQVYGKHSFAMAVIGFPTDEYGQVNLLNAAYRICINSETDYPDEAAIFADIMTSKEVISDMLTNNGSFSPRVDVNVKHPALLDIVCENVEAGRSIPGSNPAIQVEQWGNTCVMVQELFDGKSVDDIMVEFDNIQQEQIAQARSGDQGSAS